MKVLPAGDHDWLPKDKRQTKAKPPEPEPKPEEPRQSHKGKQKKPIFTYADVPSIWEFEASVTWIVDKLVPEAAITLLSGDSGSGKTIFATALAGAIVTGQAFLGHEVRQRKVLYLDRENSAGVVKQHLHDLGIPYNPDLIVWGSWCEFLPDGPAAVSLLEFAKAEKPVIVFDSLIAFHVGDESDASETRRYLQHFRNLASAGATIILLHHTGKSEGARQYRGSSDIKASVDVAYLLEKLGDPAGLLGDLRLVPFKNRIAAGTSQTLVFEKNRFRSQQRSETTRETVERLIKDNPGSTYKELLAKTGAAGLAKNQAEVQISNGVKEGRFERRKVGQRSCYFIAEVQIGDV